ncbi:unnamed protein product [Lupinus luteus]|uniref:BURP domain-containing protein n=1 Tax=Lupinus luteus TaxID=3873 RepID=A0AAV1WUI6_LUPLU
MGQTRPYIIRLRQVYGSDQVSYARHVAGDKNPFTPKASVIRYWDTHVSNNLPKPSFLLSKASPLSAIDTATFAKLAATNTLSTRLPEFCSAANLLCFPEVLPSLEKHTHDVKFSGYDDDHNFTNYGTDQAGGLDSFKNYSNGLYANPVSDFRQYSRNSAGHKEKFNSYGNDANVVDQSFHTYGTAAAGGSGEFKEYTAQSNDPDLRFSTYSDGAVGREQSFSRYSEDGNSGQQRFTSYGKGGLDADNKFKNYGTMAMEALLLQRASLITGSDTFKGYAKGADIGHKVGFKGYGINNTFKDYTKDGVSFSSYTNTTTSTIHSININTISDSLVKMLKQVEDMIDFATSVLGHNIAARTTENVNGSKTNVMVDKVRGINVPKVRVYEADLLDPKLKTKINHGVAICHLDTTAWSPTHGAFLALGSGPGRIEVCHWIFENDLTWIIANSERIVAD